MNKKLQIRPGTAWSLAIMYAAVVLVRFLLALLTSAYPTVAIDEFLYYSLGRSIATEGELLFRGQPADYSFITYPLVIAPIYWIFQDGAHYFRLIQLWNILLMSLSLFPMFGLYKMMLGDEKKAFWLTGVSMLLPDFVLGQMIFSESIIYPMFFAMLYCAFRYMRSREGLLPVFIGVLGALSYFAKPGAVVPAAVFLCFFLLFGILNKEKKQILFSALGIAALAAVFVLLQCLVRYGFHYESSLLSLYEQQIGGGRGLQMGAFLKGLALYPYYLILSGGIICAVYPFTVWRKWAKEHKWFALMILLCLLGMIVGTAWSVNRYEYSVTKAHLRYMAMYIPLMLVFCHLPVAEETQPKARGKKAAVKKEKMILPIILLGYVAVFTLVFGCDMASAADCYPFMPVAFILMNAAKSTAMKWVFNLLIIAGCVLTYVQLAKPKKNKHFLQICTGFLAVFMIVNAIEGMAVFQKKIKPTTPGYAAEAKRLVGDDDYVYVYSSEATLDNMFDVNTRKNTPYVLLNDLFNRLYENGGVYAPFVPEEARGTRPKFETPDTETMVFDTTAYPMMKFSEYAEVTPVATKYYVVRFEKDKPLADAIIANVNRRILNAGEFAILMIHNEDYLTQPLKMRFDIQSSVEQTFKIFSEAEVKTFTVNPGRAWYEVVLDNPQMAYNFSADTADIELFQYELIPQ